VLNRSTGRQTESGPAFFANRDSPRLLTGPGKRRLFDRVLRGMRASFCFEKLFSLAGILFFETDSQTLLRLWGDAQTINLGGFLDFTVLNTW
jgi:hypothetical protein